VEQNRSAGVRKLFVIKDGRWSTVARVESVEDAYRFLLRASDGARTAEERRALAEWSLWEEFDGQQGQIVAPGLLRERAEAWDVTEGNRADREAGADELRRDRGRE
jgi:hypothetical protein